MSKRKSLGKGLDMIIPERIHDEPEVSINNVSRETIVHISDIEPNKNQPRKNFNEDSLRELAESIKQVGIIQPLVLQKKDKYYEIIAGERRWRAARLAGLKDVPAIIKEYTPIEMVEVALIENIQREDLNPIEEAQTYIRLIKEFNLKQEELAERVSKSRAAVTNSMRLLKLDSRVQQMLIEETISNGHARALIPIDDVEKQYETACKTINDKLSVRETEKLVNQIINGKRKAETAVTRENDFLYRELEHKLRSVIGTKVSIQRKKNKGKIEIEYYSEDELDRIVEMLESLA